jgi:Holliday junction resolvase
MSASRAKGTAWESAIVTFLQNQGWPHAERRALNGAKDRGDIVTGVPGLIVEAKNEKRYQLGEWVNEANTEAANAGAELGVVWAHRKGKASAGDGYVIMTGATFARLLKAAGW